MSDAVGATSAANSTTAAGSDDQAQIDKFEVDFATNLLKSTVQDFNQRLNEITQESAGS